MGSTFNAKGLIESPDTATSIGTSYDAAKLLSFKMPGIQNPSQAGSGTATFSWGTIHAINLWLENISSATEVSVTIFAVSNGVSALVAEGTATIQLNIGSTTDGTAVLHGLDFQQAWYSVDGNVYLGIKTDAGTVDCYYASFVVSK